LIEIKGGFGNQIFQFCFANILRQKGYRVLINKRFYDYKSKETLNNTYRNLIFHEKYFGFRNINYIYFKIFEFMNKHRKFSKKFYSKMKDLDFNEKNLEKKFIHLDGYWQNIDNLISQKKFLIDSISKNKKIYNSINSLPKDDSLMVLVRRGDYIEMDENLDIKFYENCLQEFKKLKSYSSLTVFTDDVDWVKKQKIFNNSNSIIGPEDSSEEVINLFSKMLQNKHFIVSNSTLSLIAAFFGEQEDSIIMVADPWFRNKEKPNLFKENWHKIKQ